MLPTVPAPVHVAASSEVSALHVDGNRLVDGTGSQAILRGVSRSGTEFACVNEGGFGISLGPMDQGTVNGIKSWRANVVRIPLNEQCWLGINGIDPAYSGANYRSAIVNFVNLLNQNGLYAILDLHWSAPGLTVATHQMAMADLDHSPAFWASVASTFKGNDAVIFELFNEPWPDNQADSIDAWTCWRDGGSCPGVPFDAAGMQTLLNAVRATGATNVVAVGGVGFANYLSRLLQYKPVDPLSNLIAAWHVYNFNACAAVACWESTAAPVISTLPVLVTETGMDTCDATWWNTFLDWLDARQTGYVAWTWNRWSTDCSSRAMVTDYYSAEPTDYGRIYKTHLAALPVETATALSSSVTPSAEGETVIFSATVTARGSTAVPSGSVAFSIDGAEAGVTSLDAAGAASVTMTFADNGLHSVVGRYLGTAGFARSTSATLSQEVTNLAPRVAALVGAADPVPVGTELTLTAQFTDAGTADTHTAMLDWGDRTAAAATIAETAGSGRLTASHVYASAGVYKVSAIVTDDDGSAAASTLDAVVVFDPAAGSARGAGWFSSPAGALASDVTATGIANFGFLARYQKEGTTPFAQPGLRFKTDRFTFESTAYDWLVVTGAKAQLQGYGRVNGTGTYGFLLSVIDGDRLGKDVADKLRIRIWDSDTGAVFYDTQMSDPLGADPVRNLGGGSIGVGAGS